jgi:hypothetical protein
VVPDKIAAAQAVEVMKDAVQHFQARQGALQLELLYLKRVRQPSTEDIQRNKVWMVREA